MISNEISSGIIVYRATSDGPKFLVLYHGKGYWNFPKGKLEKNERSFRAAVREVREETGLTSKDLRFKETFKAHDRFVFMREGARVSKMVMFYLAETSNTRVRVSDEHEGYGWFLFSDAQRLMKHKNLRNILKQAYDAICGTPSSSRVPRKYHKQFRRPSPRKLPIDL